MSTGPRNDRPKTYWWSTGAQAQPHDYRIKENAERAAAKRRLAASGNLLKKEEEKERFRTGIKNQIALVFDAAKKGDSTVPICKVLRAQFKKKSLDYSEALAWAEIQPDFKAVYAKKAKARRRALRKSAAKKSSDANS